MDSNELTRCTPLFIGNATTRWKDVPAAVWYYTLGGYQVLEPIR